MHWSCALILSLSEKEAHRRLTSCALIAAASPWCFFAPPLPPHSVVSGSQQADKLDWPIANGVWNWNKCEFLPSSDAPATNYGAGASVFFHCLNSLSWTA